MRYLLSVICLETASAAVIRQTDTVFVIGPMSMSPLFTPANVLLNGWLHRGNGVKHTAICLCSLRLSTTSYVQLKGTTFTYTTWITYILHLKFAG